MLAIPNMEKPKDSCWECKAQYNSVCSLKREHIRWDGILDDCPLIDIVQCKDCKHYDTESRTFPCCTDISGAVRYMEADGFCSKGERRADDNTIKADK